MFFFVALAIWALVNVLVYLHTRRVPWIAHLPRWVPIVVFAFLAMSYLLARLVEALGGRRIGWLLEFIGGQWIGIVFLLFVCCLAADIVSGFGLWWRGYLPTISAVALIVGLALSVIATVQGFRAPVVSDYEVKMPNLPAAQDGTTVVFISDTHLGSMLGESWLRARVEQANALHPDLIILGGDIIEGDEPSEAGLLTDLQELHAPLGVWAVTGNHELHFGAVEHNGTLLEKVGARVLRDQWQELRPGLVIAGVDDLTSRRRHVPDADTSVFIDKALAGHPPGSAVILVSHTPWNADTAARDGAGLMLSGHTHGGQIWPFHYFVRWTYPLFSGRYDVGGMTVIVGRGAGLWGPRMRLWQPGEIVRVTLRSQSAVSNNN